MKHIAVILAAGIGKRFGKDTPKQFTVVNGKMLVEYSLEAFQQQADITEMVLVVPESYRIKMQTQFQKSYDKLKYVIAGSTERYLSSYQAIKLYETEQESNVLIHDAARPLVSQNIIKQVLDKLKTAKAVMVAMPAIDTIALVDETLHVNTMLDRKLCYQVQTPQAFRLSLLRTAFQQAKRECYSQATDDCGIVMRYFPQEPIAVVTGNAQNSKITVEEDLKLFR